MIKNIQLIVIIFKNVYSQKNFVALFCPVLIYSEIY